MRAEEATSWPGRAALDLLSRLAIKTELAAAPNITSIVANSTAVAARIKRHWQREAQVVHPPVNIDFYTRTQARRVVTFSSSRGDWCPISDPTSLSGRQRNPG